jgi:hypothetical protein
MSNLQETGAKIYTVTGVQPSYPSLRFPPNLFGIIFKVILIFFRELFSSMTDLFLQYLNFYGSVVEQHCFGQGQL